MCKRKYETKLPSRCGLYALEGQKGKCSMNWLKDKKMRLAVVGVVAAMVFCGGQMVNADFVIQILQGDGKNEK